jgi:hypothetical protein
MCRPATLSLITPQFAFASDYDAAEEASSILAAVKVCNLSVTEEQKRGLFATMLKIMKTPSQVDYSIRRQVETLSKLPPSDRAAMCLAIEGQAKALTQ